MDREISQRELRNQSAEVLRAVEGGETVTVTRHGEPVAQIVPLRRRRFVRTEVALEAFADAPDTDLQALRDDSDVLADPDSTPRG